MISAPAGHREVNLKNSLAKHFAVEWQYLVKMLLYIVFISYANVPPCESELFNTYQLRIVTSEFTPPCTTCLLATVCECV